MKSLLLIRHAETDMAGTFCGRSDPAVNAAGEQQICTLVSCLRDQLVEAVYSSNLRRASTTARAIADCFGIPLFCRPALREIDFGLWEGKRWDQIEEADPASSAAWIRSFPNLPAPEGEIFANFQTRVLDEAVRLFKEARFQQVAVVTHAGVMRAMIRHFSAMDDPQTWEITKNYCAVVRITQGACEALF
jgi:alpha-ribazole phosphatase